LQLQLAMQIPLILVGTVPVNDTEANAKQAIKCLFTFIKSLKTFHVIIKQFDIFHQVMKQSVLRIAIRGLVHSSNNVLPFQKKHFKLMNIATYRIST
jgi:hypothetical protein